MSDDNERVMMDCRKIPSEKNCSVTISGRKDEVMSLALHHAVSDHGDTDSPELRQDLEDTLEPAGD